MKHVTTRFDAESFRKGVLTQVVKEQTKRLEKYAAEELSEMANKVPGRYDNDTYNLQDSLVWCLYYDGKLRSHGFYGGSKAKKPSYLHAYSKNRREVIGRSEAEHFVSSYKPSVSKGWEIVWAATAPYSAYLEGGFTSRGGNTLHFFVITQRYDHIKQTLSPTMKLDYEINVPMY